MGYAEEAVEVDDLNEVGENSSPSIFDRMKTKSLVGRNRATPRLKEAIMEQDNTGQRRWSSNDNKFWGCSETHDILPAGLYKACYSDSIGFYLDNQLIETDDLIVLPDTASEEVVEEIKGFWKLKDAFEERGYLHKRGILMWGDPGSGKTSTIQLINKTIIENDGITIMADSPRILSGCLQMLRRIEPDRQIVVMMEDMDTLIQQHGENEFLALLDGESQVNNVVFIATTNYPEKLDKRFIDRPSRFDTIKFVPYPSAAARRVYLQAKEPSLEGDELEEWVAKSKGMSIAHLKEIIISNRCYGKPIDEIIDRLQQMNKRGFTSDDARGGSKLGFTETKSDGWD